ncbi:MAG: cation:proton antiporter [Bacteroidales bacterium]
MNKYWKTFIFITINLLIAFILFIIIQQGKMIESGGVKGILNDSQKLTFDNPFHSILSNFNHSISILIIQIIIIIITSRIFGSLFRMIGQPMVIGEIVAGIVLGPSLLGLFFPTTFNFLFPEGSQHNIQLLSQIGLILFMFVIGMDLDLSSLRKMALNAVIISHASIIFPFVLGMGLAYFLYSQFGNENTTFLAFALFTGIAMSITAFPVLARIIQERGWTKTPLGTMAITCAAANDILAWCLLAVVIAVTKATSLMGAVFTVSLALAFILFMLLLVKPFLSKISNLFPNQETMSKRVVGLFFIVLFCSSYLSEIIGIHALFGAFMAGVAMPANPNFRKLLIEKIEDLSMIVLLPLFFVYTGLLTQIGLLNDPKLWFTCFIIIAVAVTGKFLGSALSARFVGLKWKESLSIGILMNTRGLMELVILNIGYDLGVLSPEVFSMMVLMALVTTFMTGPALNLVNWLFKTKPAEIQQKANLGGPLKIVFSFGPSSTGIKLLKLAAFINGKSFSEHLITALHLTKGTDVHPLKSEEYARDSFTPLLSVAREERISLRTIYRVTDHLEREISNIVEEKKFDFLLIGAGKSIYTGSAFKFILHQAGLLVRGQFARLIQTRKYTLNPKNLIHHTSRKILETTPCTVGVFIDRGLERANLICVFLNSYSDIFLVEIIKRILSKNPIQTVFLVDKSISKSYPEITKSIEDIDTDHQGFIKILEEEPELNSEFPLNRQLMISSYNSLKALLNLKRWSSSEISALIINPK